jgi:hypothetical protein
MFICSKFDKERSKLIPKSCLRHKSVNKFCDLMTTETINTLKKIATFAKLIIDLFKS